MLQSVTIPDSRVPEVLYKYFPPEAVDDSAKWIPKVSLSRCCVSGGEIVRCECCRKMVREDYLGPDYGASHFFCDECLSLLEIGQGLAEDPVFAAEWKQMLKESDLGDGFGVDRLMLRDTRRAKRMYKTLAGPS